MTISFQALRKQLLGGLPAILPRSGMIIRGMLLLSIPLLPIKEVCAQTINIDSAWLNARTAPYELNTQNANYRLMTDVTTDGTAFLFSASGVSLDLNGRTVTYSNLPFTGVTNPGFESAQGGNAQVPAGWDLTNAPNARRQDSSEKLYFEDFSLRMENPPGGSAEEYILSSPVSLPVAGTYAVFAQVQGGPWNKVKAYVDVTGVSTTCSNPLSGLGSKYEGTDMSMGVICEFTVSGPTTVRAKVALGTIDTNVTTVANIDEVDIRPIGHYGIGRKDYTAPMKEVKNGTIIQGQSKGVYSHALFKTSAPLIHDLSIITNGMNSSNMMEMWHGGAKIYNNYLEANSKLPLHRHYWFSMIDLSRTAGGNEVYNNTLLNGPHMGIAHGSFDGNNAPSSIHHNTIRTRVTATNGFSIHLGDHVDVYSNTIQPFQGHGIGAISGAYALKIHDNIIEPKSWPCSEYSSYGYPNSAHGIRLKTYGSGDMHDVEVYGNTITGSTNPQKPGCYTEVSGITNYVTDDNPSAAPNPSNISIHDNVVSVHTDNYLQQHAMAFKMAPYGEVYRNKLKSNHIIVELSDNDAGVARNARMLSNTFEKGPAPSGFHTFRSAYSRPYGSNFVDTTLMNGADLKDVYVWNANYSPAADYTVSWLLTIWVRNPQNEIVGGVRVVAKDKNNTIVQDVVTDAQGKAVLELKEYTYTFNSSASASSVLPYKIELSKSGVQSSQTINLTQSQNLTATLDVAGTGGMVAPSAPSGLRVQ